MTGDHSKRASGRALERCSCLVNINPIYDGLELSPLKSERASWAIGQPKQNTCPVWEHRETCGNLDPGGTRTNAYWLRSDVPVVFDESDS
jgi:hypothetical protein